MTDGASSDDDRLVRRLVAGDDAQAWTELVDGYGPLLQGLARRMLARRVGTADAADVDEVVAEVFLALLRRDRELLRRYDPTWRLATYLGVLCRTQVLRLLRRRGRAGVGPPAAPPAAHDDVPAEAAERRAALAEALGAVPARDRLLLTLRYVEELDYAAIARLLALETNSVGPLLARARARLAERFPALAAWLDD